MSMEEAQEAVRQTEEDYARVLANQEHVDEVIKRLSSMMRHPTNAQGRKS